MKLITIEYTSDVEAWSGRTFGADGDIEPTVIAAGTQRKVDPISAKNLVENRKVAKYVGDAEEKAAAKAAVKAADKLPPVGAEDDK